MSNPKFKVGELVIVDSPHKPQFNGEYTVVGISDEVFDDRYKYLGIEYKFSGNPKARFVYDLGVNFLKSDHGITMILETSLRKKYEGSALSFQDLISSLNSPVKE